ncbi:MAG TPA: murein L,D-transpeptidase catalytic domain family protein [Bdellovibrionales bacterium]|nr:murein L,D-transpeptidase catalytic domain family protein [Bdellovibrionales bacterium]
MKNSVSQIVVRFSVASMIVTLVACAPASPVRLPDDPNSESTLLASDTPSLKTEGIEIEKASSSAKTKPLNFSHIDPKGIVPKVLLRRALTYYSANQASIPNKKYLAVIDYSKPSNKKRFYIVNLYSGAVWTLPVAHGKGSDRNADGVAERFSNSPGSNATSLGVFKTAETYQGQHGLSLRLDGLSATNSKARDRAIVIHGANYVQEKDVIQGRSWGCPAVSNAARDRVIRLLKGGSVVLAGRSY